MKKNLKNKTAFSLIELSIVIMIVGIVVAGVTQSSRLITAFRLSSARSQTQSSPVIGIKDLVAWYETTSENSFDAADADDTNPINNWYDINPQKTTKNNGTASSTARPLYRTAMINSLPVVRFDGSNDSVTLPNGTVPYNDSNYTIFIVARSLDAPSGIHRGMLGSGNYGTNNQTNVIRYNESPANSIRNYWWNVDITSTINTVLINITYVFTAHYDNTIGRKIYINGTLNASDSTTGRASTAANNTIGSAYPSDSNMYGDIAEIIIYDRALKAEERLAIERYLGKKWGISIP